jgi:hypothetical protein
MIADKTWLVKDEQGQALPFHSMLTARKPFKGLKIARAKMVRKSRQQHPAGNHLAA